MKKQISYAKCIPRLFSTLMDLSVFMVLLMPLTKMLNKYVFVKKFGAMFKAKNVDVDDYQALQKALESPEFIPYSNLSTVLELMVPMLCMQSIAIILYFILSWHIYGVTPVKYIMRMRVVDAVTFTKPSLVQSIKRFMGYILFPIGIWSIFFTPQRQMLHDKISGTVVIKA